MPGSESEEELVFLSTGLRPLLPFWLGPVGEGFMENMGARLQHAVLTQGVIGLTGAVQDLYGG